MMNKIRRWWTRTSGLEKTLISLSVILLLTIIIAFPIIVTYHKEDSHEENSEDSLYRRCKSPDCIITAGRILSKLNSTTDPCENFYDYACGNYIKTHAPSADNLVTSVEHSASDQVRLILKNWLESEENDNMPCHKNAKILYNTCMNPTSNEQYFQTVQKIIKKWNIGNWPLLDTHWMDSDMSLEERLANLILIGVPIPFKLTVVNDKKIYNKSLIQISPGDPLLYSHKGTEIRDNPMLRSYIETVLLLFEQSNKNTISGDVEDILSYEAIFIRRKEKADQECGRSDGGLNNDLGYAVMPISEMDRRMSFLNWTHIVSYISKNITQYKGLSSDLKLDEAVVFCRRHIREIVDSFEHLSGRALNNYLGWRFLFNFVQYLGPPFLRLHSDYRNYITRENAFTLFKPKWKECLSLVEQYFLPILAKVYKDKALPEDLIKEKLKIASHVRSSFTDLFTSTQWLKDQDHQKIKQKVSTSKFNIALAEFYLSWETVEAWYSKLSLKPSEHLIENILEIQKYDVINKITNKLQGNENLMEWDGLTLITPETAKIQQNVIYVHFDKFVKPYLQLNGKSYMNYAGFGSYLSRELSNYIYTLYYNSSLESKNINIFWEIAKHNTNLKLCSPETSHTSTGNTQENDTVVNQALKELVTIHVSHLAYQTHHSEDESMIGINLNQEQMFFLTYAQSLCEARDNDLMNDENLQLSSKMRVNFALKNFPSFSKAFNCPANSPMNPSEKCHILD